MVVTLSEDGGQFLKKRGRIKRQPCFQAWEKQAFDMTLPGTSQGSEQPNQRGQPQVGNSDLQGVMVRTSGAVGMFHTTSFRPNPPFHHLWQTSGIHVGPHCGLWSGQLREWSAEGELLTFS